MKKDKLKTQKQIWLLEKWQETEKYQGAIRTLCFVSQEHLSHFGGLM